MTISLDRYQELMTLPINAFNGLNKPDESPRYACSTIWKQTEREDLARYLSQAQDMREKELGYFLNPTYTVDEVYQSIRNPQLLKNKFLLALGKRVTEPIALSESVVYVNPMYPSDPPDDPVTILINTTVTDVNEIHFYKTDTMGRKLEVNAYYKNIASGVLLAKIPRARLVDPAKLDDRDDHLDYYNDANFVTNIDIMREYTDASTAVTYEREECNEFKVTALSGFGKIRDERLSITEVYPAVWNFGIPSPIKNCYNDIMRVKMSYLSGKRDNSNLDLQTCRLAHTLMPHEPCTCEPVHQYWLADVEPDPTNLVTPYGSSKAAVFVWIADSRSKIGFSTTTGGIAQW